MLECRRQRGKDFDKAASFWTSKEDKAKHKPSAAEDLKRFIASHKVCALATGCGDFIRCTPLEYTFLNEAFWIFSEGGLKFKGLKDNANACLAIFDEPDEKMFGHLHSAQIMGTASIIEPFSPEYLQLLDVKHIPEAAIRKMEEPIHLIKIVPVEADYLCSDLKQEGYDSRQHIVFST